MTHSDLGHRISSEFAPEGIFTFKQGGRLEANVRSDRSFPVIIVSVPQWYPLPGAPLGALLWFNNTSGQKGMLIGNMTFTIPGDYYVGINIYPLQPGYDYVIDFECTDAS
jgi:hypothetical protein